MQLFDENIDRVSRYSNYSENHFKYLNISDRKEYSEIRRLLSKWFNEYPDKEKNEFKSRFCSNNDISFNSSFFELYLYNLLRTEKYKIKVHPELGNCPSKPDFLASTESEEFYLEAVVSEGKSEKEKSKENLFNNFVDVINQIETKKYFLSLSVRGLPNKPVPSKRIKETVQKELDLLDPKLLDLSIETGDFKKLPIWEFNTDGFKFEIQPMPIKRKNESTFISKPVAMVSYGMKFPRTEEYVLKTLKNKVNKYKNINKPIILAFNLLDNSFSKEDMAEFLFDKNKQNSFWGNSNNYKNTRISGILFINNLFPWSVGTYNLCLFINPFAKYKYEGKLCKLPTIKLVDGKITQEDGEKTYKLLDLPMNWPHIFSG